MRTNIVIDDELMAMALKAAHCKTKKETIEKGLRLLVQISGQKKLKELKGKIKWEGDLDVMRSD